jgi:hypothetical protein
MPLAAALAQTNTNTLSPSPRWSSTGRNCCLLPHLQRNQRFELLSVSVSQCTEALFFARQDSLVTSRFPGFEKKLLKQLPQLLSNVKCYNGQNHHFATEMLATETGHLFEHIWLEVLACEKVRLTSKAHYWGETSWNWKREPYGLFHIRLNAGKSDLALINSAAQTSMEILQQVLN